MTIFAKRLGMSPNPRRNLFNPRNSQSNSGMFPSSSSSLYKGQLSLPALQMTAFRVLQGDKRSIFCSTYAPLPYAPHQPPPLTVTIPDARRVTGNVTSVKRMGSGVA